MDAARKLMTDAVENGDVPDVIANIVDEFTWILMDRILAAQAQDAGDVAIKLSMVADIEPLDAEESSKLLWPRAFLAAIADLKRLKPLAGGAS
jgi:hypothetical protein